MKKLFLLLLTVCASLTASAQIYSDELVAKAEAGDKVAQFELACAYWYGNNVKSSNERTAEWLQKAADQNFGAAIYKLGDFYRNGYCGFEKDEAKAEELYKKALPLLDAEVNEGIACSMDYRAAAYLYCRGGSEKATTKYFELKKKAAEKGFAQAAYDLGDYYSYDHYYDEAAKWFRMAAAKKHPGALFELGNDYEKALSVNSDYEKAKSYYVLAALRGSIKAARRLAGYYADGNIGMGINSDAKQAITWYEVAIKFGNVSSYGSIGDMYYYAKAHLTKDFAKAIEWYEKGADAGNGYSAYKIGYMHKEGEGVEKNVNKAIEWYKKAVDLKYGFGAFCLGLLYDDGEGVPKDMDKAVYWYKKGADLGDTDCMNNLGVYYSKVKHDTPKAIHWFEKAVKADPDNKTAKNNLERLGAKRLRAELVTKYGQKFVEAFEKGNLIEGMHIDLVDRLLETNLYAGKKVSSNAQTYTIKYSPAIYVNDGLKDVYYITFNTTTDKLRSYYTKKEAM